MGDVNNRSSITPDEIVARYKKGESSNKIAAAAGVSTAAIWGMLRRRGVLLRSKADAAIMRRKYDHVQICRDYCGGLSLNEVGKLHGLTASAVLKILVARETKSRTRQETVKRGKDHPGWRGGITITTDGYPATAEGRLHRTDMEKLLKRKLFHWEDVHHVDGNKQNGRRWNLVVMPKREHTRFHSFLRHRGMVTKRKIMKEVCVREGIRSYRFTKAQFDVAALLYPLSSGSLIKREQRVCCVKGCDGKHASRGLCSKHYQRKRATDAGFWVAGGGRVAKCKRGWKHK